MIINNLFVMLLVSKLYPLPKMSVSPEAIANEFIDLSREERGYPVSNLKLQKLVYIAHGFYLGFYKKPLSNIRAQAWKYGPVFPSLYQNLKKYGAGRVTDHISTYDRIDKNSLEADFIKGVWQTYGDLSPVALVARTHKPGTPWDEVRKEKRGRCATISDELIRAHFEKLIAENEPEEN